MKKATILLILIILIISGCKVQISTNNNLQPSEEIKKKNDLNNDPSSYWDTYIAQYEDGPGTMFVNMDLYKGIPHKKFPFLLMTGVTFSNCDSEGFPTEAEFNHLNEINDTISNLLSYYTEMIHAGTCTHGCERLDYFYIADTNGIINLLRNKYSERFKILNPYINIREDKNWDDYLNFVYPNEADREYMKNEKMVRDLYNAGDNLETSRSVDHFINFKNEKKLNSFIQSVKEIGFIIKDQSALKGNMFKFKLQISRVDLVDTKSITKITLELGRIANENNGKYDRWETLVIK